MSEAVWLALIAATPATLVAVATLVGAINIYRRQMAIARRLNGRLDQLIAEVHSMRASTPSPPTPSPPTKES